MRGPTLPTASPTATCLSCLGTLAPSQRLSILETAGEFELFERCLAFQHKNGLDSLKAADYLPKSEAIVDLIYGERYGALFKYDHL